MGMPAAGVDVVWHTGIVSDGMGMERSFTGLGGCLCVLFKGPKDDEGSAMGWRRIFDVYQKTVAGPFPGSAEKGR